MMIWRLGLVLCLGLMAAPCLHAEEPKEEPKKEAKLPEPPKKQVQVSVWIVETNDQGLRDLGANLTYSRFKRTRLMGEIENETDTVQQVNTQLTDPRNPDYTVTLPRPDARLFPNRMRPDQNPVVSGTQAQLGAGLEFSLLNDDYGTLDGIFRSVERNSEIDLISRPELLVISGERASIHAGGEVPFQDIKYDKRGNPQLDVKWQEIGVKMALRPTITDNDMVRIHLEELEVSDIARIDSLRGIDLPVFSTRQQTGSVIVPNGGSLVIGGLSSRVVRQSERRVPLLGKLPILGIPFRSRTSEVDNSHLMLLISPTIVDLRTMNNDVINALNFWRSKEWDNSEQILDEVEALEKDLY